MVQFSTEGTFLSYDKSDCLAVQRAVRYTNIKVNVSNKSLPAGYSRRVGIRVNRLQSSVIVELLRVEFANFRKEIQTVGILGVRLTGRKEELIWMDYSDCHYRTITLDRLWKAQQGLDLGVILRRAPFERYSLPDVRPTSLNMKLST